MANRIRTLNFLPEIFQTPTNAQFLGATLDQLVAQPNIQRIQGYIGSKLGYGVNANDQYVTEPTKVRTDYQLDPGVVFTQAETTKAIDFISYPGMVDALQNEGGLTADNNRLFTSQIYSWDSFTDLDKIINFNEYYWLPEGPPSVNVATDVVYNTDAYVVTNETNEYLITSNSNPTGSLNPTLTLLRGGTYTFQVNQNSSFWIQGQPGVTGYSPTQPNIQTRDVLGVTNNGASDGVITFTVPQKDALSQYNFPGNNPVDVVSNLPFDQVNGAVVSTFAGIDGITSLNGLTVMFYNDGVPNEIAYTSKFYDSTLYDQNGGVPYTDSNYPGSTVDFNNFEGGYYSEVNANFYLITYVGDPSNPVISLSPVFPIPTNQNITVNYGTEWVGRTFFRNVDGDIQLIPYNSAVLDTLYYQDGTNPDEVGFLKIIDSNFTASLNVDTEILGKPTYTSGNGVVFTNGLKVTFSGTVYPSSYLSGEYYVQGVGTAIELIPTSSLVSPGTFSEGSYIPYDTVPYDISNYDSTLYIPVQQDYITIARDAIDNNPWSRSNRWFHIEVINATATYNNDPTIATTYATNENKAKRPIIEFYPNLRLFNSGTNGLAPIDFIDYRTTNAFEIVEGATNYYPDVSGWTTPNATVNGVSGPITTVTASVTNGLLNEVTLSSTTGLHINDTIVFAGTAFGGITTGTTYYIAGINGSTVTLSLAPNGNQVVLSNGSGSMTTTIYPYSTTVVVPTSDVSGSFQIGQYIADSATVLPTNAFITNIASSAGTTTLTVSWFQRSTFATTSNVSLISTDTTVDNYSLFNGARIVFAADSNMYVRNKIYVCNFASITPNSVPVITLTESSDGDILANDQTVVYRGYNYKGKDFYFDGDNWFEAQQKTEVNQPPKFDVFDSTGISFGNTASYLGTSFTGTTLFAYGIGTGTYDSILGFPIAYSGVDNIGDISFDVTFNLDTFTYVQGNNPVTANINTGYVYNYTSRDTFTRQLGWQTAVSESVQYQVFEFNYYALTPTNTFTCDIAPFTTTKWPTIQVLINNVIQPDGYTVTTTDSSTTITFTTLPVSLTDTVVQVLILSDQVSETAYYQIPTNLNNNPLNQEITTVNVGDIRGQYQSIFYNNPNTVGPVFGSNNYRDLGNLVPWGTKIIQNSASLVLPGTFLRNAEYNLFDSLLYNSREYINFKTLLVNTVNNTDYTVYMTPAQILDDALTQITANHTDADSFFWSDMLPNKAPYISNSYSFANSLDVSIYPLSRVYDFATANYYGVLVYLTRNGVTTQLITGVDYTVSTDAPSLTVTLDLLPNDQITINEYNQTYGSYVPNTPTKLGLYPATIPNVTLDTGYSIPTYFIVGHDGSYNKLYGDYINGQLVDFRDQALFEYETRVYNNLKLSNVVPVQAYEVMPGFFRSTDYSYAEILQIYSESFLNWVGTNRVDYKTQLYNKGNQFTFNYSGNSYKIDNQAIDIGYWRGIYQYMYDTANPDTAPWEMLGYRNMPTWWANRYGPAPYTSDNLVLWGDLAAGYDYNDGNPVTLEQYVRPGLLQVLPVDSNGDLLSPFNSVLGNYEENTFQSDWQVGDVGPTEFSYRRSSSWPFDLMRLLALTKPAQFYNLAVDMDNYKYSPEFNQYLVNNRSPLVASNIQVYGDGVAKTSYLNWIVDYGKRVGLDTTTDITTTLAQLDVRLVYRLAGFSDQAMLQFYLEKSSANSNNSALLIPNESYQVLLYENQPFDTIVYSGVVVQISANGYKVFGNSQTNAYFNVLAPIQNGNRTKVEVESYTSYIQDDYTDTVVTIPYGTEFYNYQEVSQFLASYGAYLESQGLVYDQTQNGIPVTWRQMVAEFLYWAQIGWEIGSITTINPSAEMIAINKDSYIVQPLTLQQQNFILNQNLYPIQTKDMAILRDGTLFTATPLNQGDTVAYGQFNISSIEHGIVFDNVTVFNDIIYNLVTGLRQNRILVRGNKTAEWNGTLDAQGFILNQDNVVEWDPTVKYTTGSVVLYKNNYWIALTIVQPSATFNENQWKVTPYSEIQLGLLPNSSTRSYESTLYYDTNRPNLETDADLLSFSLIGYRPRDYLALVDLTDITQVNVYQNLIKNKGTLNAASAFKGANLPQGGIDYDIYENWAIKSGEFGGVLNNNFVEFKLSQSELTGNPSIVGLTNGVYNAGVQQEVPMYSLFNYGTPVTDPNILPTLPSTVPSTVYPDAGYVNFNDVKLASFFYAGLPNGTNASGTVVPLSNVYVRDYIWLANYMQNWQVYSPSSIGTVSLASNNLNGTVTITFNQPHGLTQYQPFAIVNFNSAIDGYYIVNAVVNPYKVIITLSLNASLTTVTGSGVAFMLQSYRVDQPSDINSLPLLDNEFASTLAWVDTNTDGGWAVYQKNINYKYASEITNPGSDTFGSAVAYNTQVGYLIGDAGLGQVYRYSFNELTQAYDNHSTITNNVSFGSTIVYKNNTYVISEPTSGTPSVYVYNLVQNTTVDALELVQTISAPSGVTNWGSAVALSGDCNWLYISDVIHNLVYVYRLSPVTGLYTQITTLTVSGFVGYEKFGHSISTDYYGDTIIVGAPGVEYLGTVSNWGTAYIFNRLVQNIEAQYTSYPQVPQQLGLSVTVSTISTVATATSSTAITVNSTTGFAVDMPVTFSGSILSNGAIVSNQVYYIVEVTDGTHFKISNTRGGSPISFNTTAAGSMIVTVQSTPLFVAINGTTIDDSRYFVIDTNLYVIPSLNAGDIVNVSTTDFILTQTVTNGQTPRVGAQFGTSIDTNTYASEVLISSPFELSSTNQEGAVHRFTNGGEKYGVILGTVTPTITSPRTILLNGYAVTIPTGYINEAVNAINSANITNVQALNLNNNLVIQLIDKSLATPNNKLSIVPTDVYSLAELGITVYTSTQIIQCPHTQGPTQFGTVVKFNESGSVVISAPTGTRYEATTFDFTDPNIDNDTVFDNNATQWLDTFANAGAVYMFDFIANYNDSLTNPGQFVYAQSLNALDLVYGAQPLYGTALDFNESTVVIGTPNFMPDVVDGQVVVYTNATGVQDWSVYRSSCAVVDINRIQDIQLFSQATNNTLDNLDYFDPLQGKILGAVRQNIDVVSNSDPARYNSSTSTQGGLVWGADKLGQLWFDTTNVRFVNYHQDDIVYNSSYWGTVFPGSDVAVYSWITSNVPPIQYQGPGTVYSVTDYTTQSVQNAQGQLTNVYFFWARNTNIVFTKQGNTLADSIIEQYIANPLSSGISYFAPLLPNVFGLYNIQGDLNGNDTVLHVGFSTGTSNDVNHSVFNLIRENYADDFLPGLPTPETLNTPFSLYARMLDSMSGTDASGATVPDPYLPLSVQYGILARPRQSFFLDRFGALQNYFESANQILAQSPFNETANVNFLYVVGPINPSNGLPFYNVADYLVVINWWAPGYNDNTKSSIQVPLYANLAELTVEPGTIATVAVNGNGFSETYIYNADGTWTRIGLQDGTVQISSAIWDYANNNIGFGNNYYDVTPYDEYPSEETRYILRALNEQLPSDMLIYRNQGLILLFEYIQSEAGPSQNYLPWLNKTSFIDVLHTVRELRPIEVFQSDNEQFLEGYINEVKPYHVVVKDYVFKYTGTDVFEGNITDFDLPATYNSTIQQYVTPELVYSNPAGDNQYLPTDPIWQESSYNQWFNNYGLSITGEDNYLITTLASYVTLNSSSLIVNNSYGLPVTGVIQIDDEQIGYASLDRSTNTLNGLTRGVNGSTVQTHIPGTDIFIDLPAVLVLNSGRAYSEPPKITAYIDTTIYPAPRVPAILTPIMDLDKVIGVNVINAGEGYPVLPEIIIDPSIVVQFSASMINVLNNVIELDSPLLQTGDLVIFNVTDGSTLPGGLISGQQYYINVLQTVPVVAIALYSNYVNAVNDHDRINIQSSGAGTFTLSVTASASCITSSLPTREAQITMRFDRTSYNSQLVDWEPGTYYGSFYAGNYNNSQDVSSSSIQLESTQPPIASLLASNSGAAFEIFDVTNDQVITWSSSIRNVTNTYSGTNIIQVVPANGGADIQGFIGSTIGFYIGMPVKFEGQTGGTGLTPYTTYYVKTLNNVGGLAVGFTVSDTITDGVPGNVVNVNTATVGPAGIQCYPGEVTNQAILTINYPGIRTATSTVGTTNVVTIPLNSPQTNVQGTDGFYTGLPVSFVGNVFGGVVENTTYYVTSVLSETEFTMSTISNPLITTVSATSSSNNSLTLPTVLGLSVNDPIIFSDIIVNTGSTNIQPAVQYYVGSILTGDTITITQTVNGGVFNPGTMTGSMTLASQANAVQLTTATGNMTININLPISPGQINGQLFTLYPTSNNFTGITGTISNLLTANVTATVAASNNRVCLSNYSTEIPYIYTGMQFNLSANIGGLTSGTNYTVTGTGTTSVVVTNTSSSGNVLTCANTDVLYVDMPLVFTGTSLGGVSLNTVYYVQSIVSSTQFKIEASPGSGAITLYTDNGTMTGTGDQYVTVSNTVTTQPGSVALTQYINPSNDPVFTVSYIMGGYSATPSVTGSGFAVTNVITIDGSTIGGVSGVNDLKLTVNTVTSSGAITSVICSGTPAGPVNQYYFKVIDVNQVAVCSDALLTVPVSGINFPYSGLTEGEGDYAVLPEPFYFTSSIVKYKNRVYECIVSNNDSEFILGKWLLLSSDNRRLNALDRIQGYYQPTVNMPGLDLTQLVSGITYPNSTYKGNAFAPDQQFALDTIVTDQPFYPNNIGLESVVWNGLTYVAVADTPNYSASLISADGIDWSVNTISTPALGITDLIYAGGMYVMTTSTNATPVLTSVDGITWSPTNTFIATTGMNGVAYNNGIYVAVGNSNIITSVDGSNWVETYAVTGNLTSSFNAVAYVSTNGFTGFVAVGTGQKVVNNVVVSVAIVMTSVDGYVWKSAPFTGTATQLSGIAGNADTIVVVGNNNSIYTTFNTLSWFAQTTPTGNNLNYVTYANSNFVVVGDSGVIITSPNATTWTVQTSGTTNNLTGAVYSTGRSEYTVVGDDNTVLHSLNLSTWTNASLFATLPVVYTIQGDDFTAGYGPEEMVPGVVSDSIMMTVTTRPGTNWEAEEYAHVGYNVVSKVTAPSSGTQVSYNFKNQVEIPTQLSVFVVSHATGLSTSLYNGIDYTVDWVNKNVILNTPLYFVSTTVSDGLRIDVYEPGNGDQLVKSNTDSDPINIDPITGFSEIELNCNYSASIYNGSGAIRPGTQPIETVATATVSDGNTILVENINDFILNSPITFSGEVFGGIVANQVYYVKTISAFTNEITVSTTYSDGIAGATYQLSTAFGSMEVIIQAGYGIPWTTPVVMHNGNKLILGSLGLVTSTSATNNALVTDTTNGLIVGTPIVFANTMFGGVIVPQQVYYVKSIIDQNQFTISMTLNGSILALTTAYGGASYVTNDYAFGVADNGISAELVFANQYNNDDDYLAYTIFGETTPIQYGYTLPETQLFTGNGAQSAFTLTNFVGNDNVTNAIVEVNRIRLTSTAYTINATTNQVVFIAPPASGAIVAVTSYNTTDRQYLNTQYSITGLPGSTASTFVVGSTTNIVGTFDQNTPSAQTYDENSPSIVTYDEDLNYLSLSTGNTANLPINSNIVFSAPTIGGIVAGQSYYVTQILNSTDFVISSSVGGTPVTLTTATGSMPAVVNGLTVAPIATIENNLSAPITVTNVSQTIASTDGTRPNQIVCASTAGFIVGQPVIFKASIFTAGSFTVGQVYQIVTLGTTTQSQWNTIAGTSGQTYTVGSTFTCANAGTGTGTALLASFGGINTTGTFYYVYAIVDSTHFTIADQFGSLITLTADTGNIVSYVGGLETVRVTTTINHNFNQNELIRIDGTTGSVELNNNLYYVHVLSNTEVDLYTQPYNPALNAINYPVTTIGTYTGGGYIWEAGSFSIYTTVASASATSINTITVSDTSQLVINAPVYFTGSPTQLDTDILGGLIAGQEYFVASIIDGYNFQVSATQGGAPVALYTASGTVKVSQWAQFNVDRLWVTVNGNRVPSSQLYLNEVNYLSILTEIQTGDEVIITSMMPSATPNEQVYLLNVTTTNQPSVYRANTQARTWLTRALESTDSTIYVNDITRITNTVVQTVVAPAPVNGVITVGLTADKNLISQIVVFNNTTNELVDPSNYSLGFANTAPMLEITGGVSVGNNITITTLVGNLIYVAGEQIKFTTVDIATNSITGLQRGTNGTGVQTYIPLNSEVYSLLSQNLMNVPTYMEEWNSYIYNPVLGDPLQISVTTGANFLNVDQT